MDSMLIMPVIFCIFAIVIGIVIGVIDKNIEESRNNTVIGNNNGIKNFTKDFYKKNIIISELFKNFECINDYKKIKELITKNFYITGKEINSVCVPRRTVENSRNDKFKYILKEFDIIKGEKLYNRLKEILSDREQIRKLLCEVSEKYINKYKEICEEKNIKFKEEEIKTNIISCFVKYCYIPYEQFVFYTDFTTRANTSNTIIMDDEIIKEFIDYLLKNNEKIKEKNNQRNLMTKELRAKILARDNYTCQKCGASIYEEPNLLLEVDHIIPISKGGLTQEENLQVLCWKCNREKSNK